MQRAATTSIWQGSVYPHALTTHSQITRLLHVSAIQATHRLSQGETALMSMNVSPPPVRMEAPALTWREDFCASALKIGTAHSAIHAFY